MQPFRTTRRVEFCDTDMAGIVHFANFFRWMEAAECDFLRARGLSVKIEWEGQMLGFPRVAATCDYVKPARFQDVLDIDVIVERVGTKSITFTFEFSNKGALLARGKVTSACCRITGDNHLEGMQIPATYRARLETSEVIKTSEV